MESSIDQSDLYLSMWQANKIYGLVCQLLLCVSSIFIKNVLQLYGIYQQISWEHAAWKIAKNGLNMSIILVWFAIIISGVMQYWKTNRDSSEFPTGNTRNYHHPPEH